MLFSRLKKSLKFRIENKLDQWFLIFSFEGKFEQKSLKNFQKIIPPKDRFWADPFIVFKDNIHYIFFEEYIFEKNKGHIAYFTIDKNRKIGKPIKILEQSFHLSYPFIFEYEKKFDADLIMIMTKKEELTLSDNISVTARYIINNSDIPVMSIRPKEQEYITGPTTAF